MTRRISLRIGKVQGIMVEIICPVCNKPFKIKKSRLKRSKNICCSKACSYKLKKTTCLGENNFNIKYHYDRNFFKIIDTEMKAYVLGWIASGGCIAKKDTVSIKINKKDKNILEKIRRDTEDIFTPIKTFLSMSSIKIFSKEIVEDIYQHLNINSGKKSSIVSFPELTSDELIWSFIRGFFDGDGSIRYPSHKVWIPECSISTRSVKMLDQIEKKCAIPCNNNKKDAVAWYGNNAIDFLGKIYENANIYLDRKREIYIQISMWRPSLKFGKNIRGYEKKFYWSKIKDNAIPPYKKHASDSGYDLTLVEKIKQTGIIEYYSTNLKIKPAYGWYFDLIPRSSMPKTGYCLANDIGIIDRTYTGPIIAMLRKFDSNAKDLELPARIVQIIPRPIIHFNMELIDDLEETNRSSGGFGSTGV